jgi:putative transposase
VSTAAPSYTGHRYPVEVINQCVWLYFRFSLSFREVEELMLARGVMVSYETIVRWCAKFGVSGHVIPTYMGPTDVSVGGLGTE